MKRHLSRWIWVGLLVLSLLAISFYGGPVSYGFFFFVLITPLMSALYVILVYFRFKVYQKSDAKVIVAETPVAFYYSLQNEDAFAFAGIRTDFFSKNSTLTGIDPDTEYELFPHTGIQRETRLICKYKGEYEVGVKSVTVTDFLRLFRITFRNREAITVTVIPRLVILDDLSAFDALPVATVNTPANPTEPDVLVRDYVPGDDIRNINWKLTAATGKPLIRGRVGETTPAVSIIMDACRISRDPDVFLPPENKLLETTIALAYYYLERGIRVNAYSYAGAPLCMAMETVDDFEGFYQRMSYFTFSTENTPDRLFSFTESVPDIGRSSVVIFVVHELGDPYIHQVAALEQFSVATVTCLVTDRDVQAPNLIRIGYDDSLKEVLS